VLPLLKLPRREYKIGWSVWEREREARGRSRREMDGVLVREEERIGGRVLVRKMPEHIISI
jgi:hypothetical protein